MTDKFHDKASQALNLAPVEAEITQAELLPAESADKDLEDDFNYSRIQIREAIEQGRQSMVEIAEIADQTTSPRAYEVVATMMKGIVEGSKTLVELSKTRAETHQAKRQTQEGGQSKVTNNILVTTKDLQKLIEDGGV